MFWFYATARKIEIKKSDTLVSDSVNVYPCQFQFSSDWAELTKTAVFRAGTSAIEVLLDETLKCNIPWEVLLKDKVDLYVGCYGTKGDDIILNTTWTNVGKIYEGTKNKAVPGEDPTPDIYTQILSQMGDLSTLETDDKSSLVNAINEIHDEIGSGTGPDGPLPAGVASFNGRTGAVLPKAGDYTPQMVGATPAENFESFKTETTTKLTNLQNVASILNNDKIDKSGGTFSGPVMFSDETSQTADSNEENVSRGTIISSNGISKTSSGPLNIETQHGIVSFGTNTKLSNVLGDENDLTSVPNMGQLNQKISDVQDDIPVSTSDLTNDSGFATEQYVQNAILEAVNGISSGGGVPTGTIVIWSGTTDNIPTGWHLCDGSEGTPDLRDKFVLGAGTSHAIGSTGGSETVKITKEQMPKHIHELNVNLVSTPGHAVAVLSAGSSSNIAGYLPTSEAIHVQNSGNDQPHNNMPPYYTLCYIIKVA